MREGKGRGGKRRKGADAGQWTMMGEGKNNKIKGVTALKKTRNDVNKENGE